MRPDTIAQLDDGSWEAARVIHGLYLGSYETLIGLGGGFFSDIYTAKIAEAKSKAVDGMAHWAAEMARRKPPFHPSPYLMPIEQDM